MPKFQLGISYEELKNNLLDGFRLTNPKYSPPEISHMVQTCWLADPKERPTFTALKQITWEIVSSCDRENDGNMTIYSSALSDSRKPYKKYNKMRKCNPLYQREKAQGKTKLESKDECSNSPVTQCYADLDLTMLKESSKKESIHNNSILENTGNEKEYKVLPNVPDKFDTLEDIPTNNIIKPVRSLHNIIFDTFTISYYSYKI